MPKKSSEIMDSINSDSDSEGGFRINKDYAERYNKWRQKEELQKLKDKYGDVSEDEDESSSDSEDEDAEGLTDKLDKEWLQTLTALKRKDPKIYDKSATFYDSSGSEEGEDISDRKHKKERKKEKPYLLKDYQRDIIVEKGGVLSDSENEEDAVEKILPTNYHEEQLELKKSFKSAAKGIDESDSEEDFLTKREVTKKDREREDEDYDKWLKDQKPEKGKLVGIDPWDKPNLTQDEKFLRDYILNKKYVNDSDDDERIPTYDEIVNVDEEEEELEKQETFERKFNFRYEDPDQEFIKSYPRTVGESVRRKDDRRAKKRQEAREKKLKEKEKKKEELKQMKNLKKREIMDKIDLIKEVTGNTDIGFAPEDIEDDFDPAKYDKMMKDAFNDNYYDEPEDETKPTFDDEEEFGISVENWDDWVPEETDQNDDREAYEENTNQAENSDWDLEQESGSKKRKRKSKFAKAVARKKPVFDPNDKTFEEYLDEYYKLDYEDIIGDQPCRFKYRSVVANDFGLSTDDILKAKERELNQWVSVKRMSQYRTKEDELYDVRIYQKKSKRKTNVLISLKDEQDGNQTGMQPKKKTGPAENTGRRKQNNQKRRHVDSSPVNGDHKRKRGKKRRAESSAPRVDQNQSSGGFVKKQKLSAELNRVATNTHSAKGKEGDVKKKNKRKKKRPGQRDKTAMSDERLKAYGINPKKFKYTKAKYTKK